jgi:hypothetical protein
MPVSCGADERIDEPGIVGGLIGFAAGEEEDEGKEEEDTVHG